MAAERWPIKLLHVDRMASDGVKKALNPQLFFASNKSE